MQKLILNDFLLLYIQLIIHHWIEGKTKSQNFFKKILISRFSSEIFNFYSIGGVVFRNFHEPILETFQKSGFFQNSSSKCWVKCKKPNLQTFTNSRNIFLMAFFANFGIFVKEIILFTNVFGFNFSHFTQNFCVKIFEKFLFL